MIKPTYFYIDIETIPTDRTDVIESFASQVKPPATYKKPESIAQWIEENLASEIDAIHRKTALDGAFGQVCVIGFAMDDGPADAVFEGSEADILNRFARLLELADCDRYTTQFIGHNITDFDLRFLVQRYMVNRIPVPPVLKDAAFAKPWDIHKVFDTMTQWAGIGNRVSLDKLCKALSIPTPKGDLDGSKVWDYVKAGKLNEVVEYCKRDIEATREIHRIIK